MVLGYYSYKIILMGLWFLVIMVLRLSGLWPIMAISVWIVMVIRGWAFTVLILFWWDYICYQGYYGYKIIDRNILLTRIIQGM